jgi:hypothetical protein
MALLDLQGMEAAPQTNAGGSSNSKHSCDPSSVSLLLCSHLSILLCE